ncbi:MAG: hypothetical protein IKH38_00825 [Clostridia bacterium]|nr:hypothetical protein [Clostridia bacterium]
MKGREFTIDAEERFYDVVDDPLFHSEDRNLIYQALQRELRPILFGEYLRRYIYGKAGMTEDFESVPVSEYQQILVTNFRSNETPASFGEGRTSLRAMAKNWLTQQTVSRQVVLLLGFGLRMTVEEVNEFLTKALHEHRLSPKDPMEVICRYCYQNRLDYDRFDVLYQQFRLLNPTEEGAGLEATRKLEGLVSGVQTDRELFAYLERLMASHAEGTRGTTARLHFGELYAKAQALTANFYNTMAAEDMDIAVNRLQDALDRDDGLYEDQKRDRVQHLQERRRTWTPAEISPADMEKVFCSSIPMRKDGNYLPIKESQLYRQFEGKRFHRKHMHDILAGKAAVTRFDLITLNFYCCAMEADPEERVIARYGDFVNSTNALLEDSSMGSLYLANPYECFVLMCMLSEDPLGTYADVWELSFQESQGDESL